MRLNPIEFALMNNPLRAGLQRYIEAPRLLRMGGPVSGGCVLEIGCGNGTGTRLILDLFGAHSVDAFDLDPRMVRRASRRLADRRNQVSLWVGDASNLSVPDGTYDAVFDFGIIHHVPEWRAALVEVHRVLKPGGRLYAEEILAPFIRRSRYILKHPPDDRFTADQFSGALAAAGLHLLESRQLGDSMAWFVAVKPA